MLVRIAAMMLAVLAATEARKGEVCIAFRNVS